MVQRGTENKETALYLISLTHITIINNKKKELELNISESLKNTIFTVNVGRKIIILQHRFFFFFNNIEKREVTPANLDL